MNAAVPYAGSPMQARKVARLRPDEQRAKSARVAIVISLFFVLVIAAVLVGGRAVIDPLLQSAAASRDAKRMGEIVYSMPDGMFCRHLSFDNGTSELIEGAIDQCPNNVTKRREKTPLSFAWGGR